MECERAYFDAIRRLMPGLTPLQLCGVGSYGAVYVAQDETGRLLAVKYLRLDEPGTGSRERSGLVHFCRTIRGSQNLISVYHVVSNDHELCYTMELADDFNHAGGTGENYCADTLARRIAATPRMAPAAIIAQTRQLINAVEALHAAGLVHRDIKPDNVLFCNGTLKLGDVGLVSLAGSEPSAVGTLSYMPPESRPGARLLDGFGSDLYGLGITIYCMLSGREGKDFPSLPPAVLGDRRLAALNAFVGQACSPDPARRFANIREFREAFEEQVCHDSTALRLQRRRRLLLGFNAVVALALAAAILALLFYRRQALAQRTPAPQDALPWWAAVTPSIRGSQLLLARNLQEEPGTSGDGWELVREADGAATLKIAAERLTGDFEVFLQFSCAAARLQGHLAGPGDPVDFELIATSRGILPPELAPATPADLEGTATWGLRLLARDGRLRLFANTRQLAVDWELSTAAGPRDFAFRLAPMGPGQCDFEQFCLFGTNDSANP